MVEGHQVLQGVRVHDEEAAVVQAHRQGFAVGGEAAAAATFGGSNVLAATATLPLPASGRPLTFAEFAHGQHAVAGREVPYAQGFVIADGGAQREVGVAGQAPHFSLHVTLRRDAQRGF